MIAHYFQTIHVLVIGGGQSYSKKVWKASQPSRFSNSLVSNQFVFRFHCARIQDLAIVWERECFWLRVAHETILGIDLRQSCRSWTIATNSLGFTDWVVNEWWAATTSHKKPTSMIVVLRWSMKTTEAQLVGIETIHNTNSATNDLKNVRATQACIKRIKRFDKVTVFQVSRVFSPASPYLRWFLANIGGWVFQSHC